MKAILKENVFNVRSIEICDEVIYLRGKWMNKETSSFIPFSFNSRTVSRLNDILIIDLNRMSKEKSKATFSEDVPIQCTIREVHGDYGKEVSIIKIEGASDYIQQVYTF